MSTPTVTRNVGQAWYPQTKKRKEPGAVGEGGLVHALRQSPEKVYCIQRHCTFAAPDWPSALFHTAAKQWTASGPLPPELQLTPEQEAA